MALYDDSIGLESFLQRTTRVSQRLAAYQPSVTTPQLASVAASSPVPEPMQIDSRMDYVFTVDDLVIFYVPVPSDPHTL
ncbi:hypothetical protein M9458_029358, partial [Cirrhinus mrigala]